MLSKTLLPLALAALFFGLPAHAAESFPEGALAQKNYFYKQLDSYVISKKPVMYILERVNEKLKKEPTILPVVYTWTREMTGRESPDQVNSLYYMLRSDMAHKMAKSLARSEKNFKKLYANYGLDALQSLMNFEMLLMADTTRCVNPKFSGAVIGELLSKRYDVLGQYTYSLLPPADMVGVWKEAINTEANLRARHGNPEICSNAALIATILMDEDATRKVPEEDKPQYMDDKEWDEARDGLRYSIKDFWKTRYEERTGKNIPAE